MVGIKTYLPISVKLLFVTAVSGVIIVFGVAFVSAKIFGATFNEFYKNIALSAERSFEAAIGVGDLGEHDRVHDVINKIIYLNPEISRITISAINEQNGQLEVVDSNDESLVGMPADEQSVLTYKSKSVFSDEVVIRGNQPGVRLIAPVYIAGNEEGVCEIIMSTQRVRERTRSQMFLLLGLIIVVVLLSSGIIFIASTKYILKPVKKLRNAMTRISQGDYTTVGNAIVSNDEIGEMAGTFNEMAQKLKVSYEELEDKVNEKTKDLNEKLEEMEKMNELMIGRELAMVELKKKLQEKVSGKS